MTTEEKAKEIIGGGCNRQDCHECGGSLSVVEGCVEFRHLKEMAKWREQQIIEKACEWLKENMSVVNANAVNYGDISFAAAKIIGGKENFLEQFKKAMKGGGE